jgi:hypothetical protein
LFCQNYMDAKLVCQTVGVALRRCGRATWRTTRAKVSVVARARGRMSILARVNKTAVRSVSAKEKRTGKTGRFIEIANF